MKQCALYSVFGKSLCIYKRCYSSERTTVSKNLIKQLHILQVLHFNRCLTTKKLLELYIAAKE
jgi:hypothetical protein